MLCFEIWLNGKMLHVIGHENAIALMADILFHNKHDSQFLNLSAITVAEGPDTKECVWEAPQIGLGDEVLIKLVESDSPQPPDHELLFAQRMAWPWRGEKSQCSFCGADADEEHVLFEGRDARICNKCIEFRHQAIVRSDGNQP